MRPLEPTRTAPTGVAGYGIALVCVAVAILARYVLDPTLGESRPYVTIFAGVALAVWISRWRAATLAAVAGYVVAEYLFVQPRFGIELAVMLEDFFAYAFSAAVIIFIGDAMHRQKDRANHELAKRREQQQQLEEQARLLDLSFDAIAVRDPAARVTFWSSGAERAYGYSRAEALGRNLHELLRTEFPEPLESIDRLLERRGSWSGELVHTCKDGTRKTMTSRWVLDRDPHSDTHSVLETNTDTTPRKRAEEQLRLTQQRLTLALDAAFLISFEWDIQRNEVRRFTSRDPALPPAAEAPSTFEAVCAVVHPDDRAKFTANVHAALAHPEGQYNSDFRIVHADGSVAWLCESGRVERDREGRPIRLIGLSQDVTARAQAEEQLRESEARFRGVFENAAAGVAIVGLDARFLRVNDTFCSMVAYTREELQDMTFVDITHPEDLDLDVEKARRLFAGEIPVYTIEKRYVRKGGAPLWVTLSAAVQRDAKGDAQFGIAVVSDLTMRKQAEAELACAHQALAEQVRNLDALVEQRTTELREVAQQLETFSYSVAHDLRAPLRSMRNFAELLVEEYGAGLDATARDYLARISRSADRMDKLITDVLAYSRVTQREAPLSTVELDPLVAELISEHAQTQETAGTIEVEGPLPAVHANAVLLSQVLSNLIGNGLKFVPPGEAPRVTIGAEVTADRVRVWVKDCGIGIPAEYRDQLFGLFQRLHGTNDYPGTGVGLATAKKAIERMGGQIGFESEPGTGTRFWFELPSARTNHQQPAKVGAHSPG